MHYPIRDLNQDEKPREKIINFGPQTLSDTELLALLLRSGGKGQSAIELAREILKKFESLNNLKNVDIQRIKQVKNVHDAKATTILAAFELLNRLDSYTDNKQKLKISKPQDIVNLLKTDLYKQEKEHLYLITLDTRNKLISKDLISVGTVNETLVSPREIFKQALLRNATTIVIVHNHPSNDPTPSNEDIIVTQNLYKAATDIGLSFLDHIVITDSDYVSMKSLGLLNRKEVNNNV